MTPEGILGNLNACVLWVGERLEGSQEIGQ